MRGTEQRDNRRVHSGGKMHRPGIAADQHVEFGKHCAEIDEIELADHIDDRKAGEHGQDLVYESTIRRSAGQHNRRAVRTSQRDRDFTKSLRVPLLRGASSADMDADERAPGTGQRRRRPCRRLGRQDEGRPG